MLFSHAIEHDNTTLRKVETAAFGKQGLEVPLRDRPTAGEAGQGNDA